MMDLYKVLGVCRGATGEELKAAFRKLALQFHPDRHAQSPKQQQELAARRFREAADAYQTLSDPQKRATYDRKGHHPPPFSSYGGGYSHSSSSASSSCYNQWHHQRNQYYSSPRRRPDFWSFRINLSPLDVAFHAIFAATIIVGLVYGAFVGDLMWNQKNAGKSFEDVLRGKQQRVKEEYEEDR